MLIISQLNVTFAITTCSQFIARLQLAYAINIKTSVTNKNSKGLFNNISIAIYAEFEQAKLFVALLISLCWFLGGERVCTLQSISLGKA